MLLLSPILRDLCLAEHRSSLTSTLFRYYRSLAVPELTFTSTRV